MPVEIGSSSLSLSSVAAGAQSAVQQQRVEQQRLRELSRETSTETEDASNTFSQESERATSQATEVRRAEALQQLERDNFRVRRDDDSELDFQARRAVQTFKAVDQQSGRQDASELLGIDTFA